MEQYKYLLLSAAIIIAAAGQLFLKAGAESGTSIGTQFLSFWTFGGLTCYFLSAMFYIAALRHIPLSVAYPSVSVSYILVVVASHLIWRETVSWTSFAGAACIGLGVLLVHLA